MQVSQCCTIFNSNTLLAAHLCSCVCYGFPLAAIIATLNFSATIVSYVFCGHQLENAYLDVYCCFFFYRLVLNTRCPTEISYLARTLVCRSLGRLNFSRYRVSELQDKYSYVNICEQLMVGYNWKCKNCKLALVMSDGYLASSGVA